MAIKHLHTPLSDDDVLALKAGDSVLISSVIYTARDAAHKKMAELIEKGEPLPRKGREVFRDAGKPLRRI